MAGKIEFGREFDGGDGGFVLMQVDDHVLQAIEHTSEGDNQNSVTFTVSEKDHAVLCTEDRTYSVKHADVSNAHYVVPSLASHPADPLAFPVDEARHVVANMSSYFEVRLYGQSTVCIIFTPIDAQHNCFIPPPPKKTTTTTSRHIARSCQQHTAVCAASAHKAFIHPPSFLSFPSFVPFLSLCLVAGFVQTPAQTH